MFPTALEVFIIVFVKDLGFDTDNLIEFTIDGMRIFYTLFTIIVIFAAIYLMKDYLISEERANDIKEQLKLKNKLCHLERKSYIH